MSSQTSSFATEQGRQRIINAAISYQQGLTPAVAPAEQHLLQQFATGRLTIDEVVYYLEATAQPQSASL